MPVLVDNPGMRIARLWWPRPTGIESTTSFVITRCSTALCTSTIGDSPLTVMVSATPPTFISTLTVAVNVPVSWMSSRLTVANPVSVKLTV